MPDSQAPSYRIFAVRYGHIADRAARDNFVTCGPRADLMPMDFFLWAIVGQDRVWIVDTGYSPSGAERRGRSFVNDPADALAELGIECGRVGDVIVTHMHYDHVGNFGLFPNATFHLQDAEMNYATGRYMCHPRMRAAYEGDEVADIVRLVHAGRVQFHEGDEVIAPGLSVHHVGGHTAGLQVVRVKSERGWVVLASDALHFYANFASPFPDVFNIGDAFLAFDRVRRLADSDDHIIPGHDPLVMSRFPPAAAHLAGKVAMLDVVPSGQAR